MPAEEVVNKLSELLIIVGKSSSLMSTKMSKVARLEEEDFIFHNTCRNKEVKNIF